MIRKWFGSEREYNEESLVAQEFDIFLKLYAEGIKLYAQTPEASSLLEVYEQAKINKAKKVNSLFVDWIKESAIPYFKNDLLVKDFKESTMLVNQIKYIEYILDDSIQYVLNESNNKDEDIDVVRIHLVDMVEWMPERIENSYIVDTAEELIG
jgi:hypothetical protein